MTHRVYEQQALALEQIINLSDHNGHHLRRVRRIKQQDTVCIFNGQGGEFLGEIVEITTTKLAVKLRKYDPINRQGPRAQHLICAQIKKNKLDYLVEKATELGAASIQLVATNRSLPMDKLPTDRFEKIIIQAAQQSGLNLIPQLKPSCTLQQAVDAIGQSMPIYFGKLDGKPLQCAAGQQALAWVIGPEGGFDDEEIAWLQGQGARGIMLAPRTLRAETAALSALVQGAMP